jgi:Zn-dependent M28 family amino/carboxypeptidase
LGEVPEMKKMFLAASAALTLVGCDGAISVSSSAEMNVPEVEAGELSEETMVNITRELSSDEFQGRMPGTIGEEKTVALLIEEYKKAGLEPGNGDSWVQNVPLVEITGSDFAPLTVKGDTVDLSFNAIDDWVGVSYREDAETKLEDAELVFVGYGINAPEKDWNDYEGVDMKGKIAVILVNDPDYENDNLEGPFNGKAMTYYGRWTYKYEEAAKQGAAGALIIHDTEPASYGWNVVSTSWSGPQAYAARGDNPPPLTQMNGWVQKGVGEQILKAAGQDFAKLSEAAKSADFKPVPLGLTASTSFKNSVKTYESQNVIGILPGSEKPDEYIIHTAHWDHLGICAPGEADEICNGAVDNATGTAALVALAEAHGKAGAPARSLVFLAVTAEEQGLLGADYYASNPIFPLSRTVGGINMDAFQVAGPAKDVTVVGPRKSQLDAFLNAALEADGRVATDNPKPEAGFYYRSDHFAFAKRGVPMLYVDGGEDLIDGGKEAGAAVAKDYTENRYHAPGDEFNEEWDWSGVMGDLQLYYRIGRMLAMSDSWPNWVEGDEFKGIRDESCAAGEGC